MPNDVKGESKKMLTYKEMRRRMELSPEHVKLTNFTRSFYQIFCDAWRGKNYRAVFETDFYIKDGFSYCVFLELFEESLPKLHIPDQTCQLHGEFPPGGRRKPATPPEGSASNGLCQP